MQENNWINSDELQWIRQEGENTFEVINAYSSEEEEGSYDVTFHCIDLEDYQEADLVSEISGFYDSLAHLKSTNGDSWKRIVAECISENDAVGNETSMTTSELIEYLKGYSIVEDLMEAIS